VLVVVPGLHHAEFVATQLICGKQLPLDTGGVAYMSLPHKVK